MPYESVHQRIVAEANAAGFNDFVSAHLAVLRYPGPGGRRPSDLAAEAGVTRQAMNYLLGQLEQLGYLLREDDPDDLRSKRVQLTERGEALRRTIRESVTAIEHELEEELGQVSYSQLRELLLQLNATETVRRSGVTGTFDSEVCGRLRANSHNPC
jgi:DNA-binding MarR family transcriptional regulator